MEKSNNLHGGYRIKFNDRLSKIYTSAVSQTPFALE